MKKAGLLIGLIVISFLVCSCKPSYINPTRTTIPRCEKFADPGARSTASSHYKALESGTCVAYIQPFDQAAWYESNLNSQKIRGRSTIRIGCTHCPGSNIDCNLPSNCGGCSSALLNFDFSLLQEDAEIVVAYLALYAVENQDQLEKAIVEGRVNIGGDYAVVSQQPKTSGQWVMYDITPFACRAVMERRNSASFEISLPCGTPDETRISTVSYSASTQPILIIEYR